VPDCAGFDPPPRCPRCRGIVQPVVVLFGEELPEEKMPRSGSVFEAGFDLVFVIGTSSSFAYIAATVLLARESGIPTAEIKPGSAAVTSEVDVKIAGGAAGVLDWLWQLYLARGKRP
jgi:NAD-dependent deacetylase